MDYRVYTAGINKNLNVLIKNLNGLSENLNGLSENSKSGLAVAVGLQ